MLSVLLAAALAAPGPWAAVSPCEAVFYFPARADGWTWDLAKTPVSRMEYAWLVDVPVGDARYQWGVTKFKMGGPAQSGSLKDLLSRTQTNAWDVTADGGKDDRSSVVLARSVPGEGGLRVVVRNPKHLAELYKLRTGSVTFKTIDPKSPKWRTVEVPVRYLDSLESVGESSCPGRQPSS